MHQENIMFPFIQLMTLALFAIGDSSQEETCYDKFEYVFKVMGRLGDLEKKQQSDYDEIIKKVEDVSKQVKILSSDTYIRWGRTSCPNGTSLVYDGFAAGSYYNINGAAVNHLCLAKEPKWNDQTKSTDFGGEIYGAEYQFKNLHNHDVPCAVCRVLRGNVLMVPGRNDCHQNYRLEYSGYLMSGHRSHTSATEFVCVDDEPEALLGTSKDLNGILFYSVVAKCGSLKCPPYEEGKQITCAVCSFSG